ncbi:arginase deacetylase [Suillus clintonianus]|uniref:arginase deacetylase n=1 Tax=Suillus clintonianus TaxID=1904413 RepID=UPI001B870942|nr:arginase deacetylase [Suillus clintonianus]KAG2133359.1 arginase deacetylase [Suillus clintonianus]
MSSQATDSTIKPEAVDPLGIGAPLPLAHVLSEPKVHPSSPQAPTHVKIYLQDDCLKHRFIRSRDASSIVERPERLRAVKIGLAAAIARIEEAEGALKPSDANFSVEVELAAALDKMNIAASDGGLIRARSISVTRSTATVDLLDNAAVKYVHGDIDGDVYLQNLKAWARDSEENITKKGSEMPEGTPPLDLYLCPSSIDAIQGAIGAVCQAVDAVIASTGKNAPAVATDPQRAFVAVRPPGHHCGEDTPSGFCFVNNVAIGAAHAHLKHGIQRIVILDIDLHHGNGTQSIVWQINEETYQQTLESEQLPSDSDVPPQNRGPQIYYGSIHDVLSFPCEDGKATFVQAASTSIHGPHGQYIENIHLQTYNSEAYFWDVLYKEQYSVLLKRASEFLDSTGGPGDDVLVFISCGFDACEHEYPSMSRHNRKAPTSFYHRFALDTCAIANVYARGRVVSVLEGGYSDRALSSGAMAHICGLVGETVEVDERWWNLENLIELEKATKARKFGSPSLGNTNREPWLTRTSELLSHFDLYRTPPQPSRNRAAPTSRTLRERKKLSGNSSTPEVASKPDKDTHTSVPVSNSLSISASASESEVMRPLSAKKLPRVILHVKPPENTS